MTSGFGSTGSRKRTTRSQDLSQVWQPKKIPLQQEPTRNAKSNKLRRYLAHKDKPKSVFRILPITYLGKLPAFEQFLFEHIHSIRWIRCIRKVDQIRKSGHTLQGSSKFPSVFKFRKCERERERRSERLCVTDYLVHVNV